MFHHFMAQCFGSPVRDRVTSGVLEEVKYGELDVIKCCNNAESARNELYGRFNPYIEGLEPF